MLSSQETGWYVRGIALYCVSYIWICNYVKVKSVGIKKIFMPGIYEWLSFLGTTQLAQQQRILLPMLETQETHVRTLGQENPLE